MLAINESRSIMDKTYKALISESVILEAGKEIRRNNPIDFVFPPGFDTSTYFRMPHSAHAHNTAIEYRQKLYKRFATPGFIYYLGYSQSHYQGKHLFFAHSVDEFGFASAPDFADIIHHPEIFQSGSLLNFPSQSTNTVIPMFFPSRISPWLQWSQYLYPLAKLIAIKGKEFCAQLTFLIPDDCPKMLMDELALVTNGADIHQAMPGRSYIIKNIGGFSGSCLVSSDLILTYEEMRND
jgi:hypothetical protein